MSAFRPIEVSTENCSLMRTLDVVGDRWTIVVLREVFVGIRRFEDIRRHTGVPRQVLTNRLGRLVDEGLLVREPYREPGARERHEYRLTPKGLDLQPAMIALTRWGDRHLADAAGPPVEFRHRECGEEVRTATVCAAGHVLDDARETRVVAGPGARPSA
ncbi:helix-turn-helix domain-containing protein [Nocardioides zeae]|uniref:Helix-turn-helix domain-containing protein n=1 Tax=Nocardioides imazamoxiresistens TaxID=3231893 RepID=A0ABU3PQN0_9ACTN|nr:helix-turn-helix domain-containing protein [Nocardioides zeae]MDT9591533.1 helix-turn-helix domain-containing protein [Nocardioides zeae]